jgi:sugar phosphate isomerase/epimerase
MATSYKGRFPFRPGCTSYVLPADIEPNVRFMAPLVDDVELVLFESESFANLPSPGTIDVLSELGREHDVTYTVHFPLDAHCGSPERKERERFIRQALKIIELTAPLNAYAFIVHLEGLGQPDNSAELRRWTSDCRETCARLVRRSGIPAERFAVENLGYRPRLHGDVVDELGLSHCLDVGHLWMGDGDWSTYAHEVLERTRVVHLHGIHDGRDHTSLAKTPSENVALFSNILRGSTYGGVVTLEVFNEHDTFESLEVLDRIWHA